VALALILVRVLEQALVPAPLQVLVPARQLVTELPPVLAPVLALALLWRVPAAVLAPLTGALPVHHRLQSPQPATPTPD